MYWLTDAWLIEGMIDWLVDWPTGFLVLKNDLRSNLTQVKSFTSEIYVQPSVCLKWAEIPDKNIQWK